VSSSQAGRANLRQVEAFSARPSVSLPVATAARPLEALFEDVESALRGLAADRQGGEEHENVFFGGDEQVVFAAVSPTLEA